MSDEARKDDVVDNKNRLDLIPVIPLAWLGRVCQHGAKRYGENNCYKGFKFSRLIGALMRHAEAFRAGEDDDPDSLMPHLAQVMWNAAILLDMTKLKYGTDDRRQLHLSDRPGMERYDHIGVKEAQGE